MTFEEFDVEAKSAATAVFGADLEVTTRESHEGGALWMVDVAYRGNRFGVALEPVTLEAFVPGVDVNSEVREQLRDALQRKKDRLDRAA